MGMYKHQAVVVTGWFEDTTKPWHDRAVELFGEDRIVTPLQSSRCNDFCSFAILPHGGKYGWEVARTHDAKLDAFCEKLRAAYEGMSNTIEFVRVEFGGDAFIGARAISGSEGNY